MFGNSILEIGVHATESKPLVAGLSCLLEGVVGKLSVITAILLDVDAMLGGKLLDCLLGKHGLSNGVVDLEMHKMQVIHKNSAVSVPLLGECPLKLGKKAHLG